MRYFLAFATSLVLWGATLSAQSTKISGQVEDLETGKVNLEFFATPLGEIKSQVVETKKGKFDFELELTQPAIARLSTESDDQQIFLLPGEALSLKFRNGKLLSTVRFEGKTSRENMFLRELRVEKGDSKLIAGKEQSDLIASTAIDLYEMDMFMAREDLLAFYNKHPFRKEFSPEFQELFQKKVRYGYLNSLLNWSAERAKKSGKRTMTGLPRVMWEEFTPESLKDEAAFLLPDYQAYLQHVVAYLAADSINFEGWPDKNAMIYTLEMTARQNLPERLYSWHLANLMAQHCKEIRPSLASSLFNKLKYSDKQNYYQAAVEEKCDERMAMKDEDLEDKKKDDADGKDSGKFKLVSMDGKSVKLKQFRGKVVYVDFWASWCGPCRQQFPHAKALKSAFSKKEQKNIVFLYINIDKDEKAWKKAVEQLSIEGTHTRSPGGWNSSAATFYRVNSIPRYMLLDKNGRIADGNAKRPSQKSEIMKEIRELLAK